MKIDIVKNLSVGALQALILGFDENRMHWYPNELPGLQAFISKRQGNDGAEVPTATKEGLLERIAEYRRMLVESEQDIADYEFFPARFVYSNAEKGFCEFKAKQIARGAEATFEGAYQIFVAYGIQSFFISLAEIPEFISDDSIARLVECSMQDGFFASLLDTVADTKALETVGDNEITAEILAYSRYGHK
jgi:hypothetical protein